MSYTDNTWNVHWKENMTFSLVIQIQKTDKENIILFILYWKELLSWPNFLMLKFITSVSNTSDLCNIKFSRVQVTCYFVCTTPLLVFVCAICSWYIFFIDHNLIIGNVISRGIVSQDIVTLKYFVGLIFKVNDGYIIFTGLWKITRRRVPFFRSNTDVK